MDIESFEIRSLNISEILKQNLDKRKIPRKTIIDNIGSNTKSQSILKADYLF